MRLVFQFAIERNFADNLFSVYDPSSPYPFFQIDANLAYPSAVLVRTTVITLEQIKLNVEINVTERFGSSARCAELRCASYYHASACPAEAVVVRLHPRGAYPGRDHS